MMPNERRRIAERVRNRWYAARRREPEPWTEEVVNDPKFGKPINITVEEKFDLYLTGIDKNFLEELGVSVQ